MSQVYSTEPSTTGRVILETSHGPIDISLWCKECPTTTRAFLQLCLDGYYDFMVFHRIMDNFLIQAGQIRYSGGEGTAVGGENGKEMDEYLREHGSSAAAAASAEDGVQSSSRRKLEVSPRIRFNHRGQVALALPLDDDGDGGSGSGGLRNQFFITLDETPFLDAKHVIFGTVSGPTVFNALRIGKVEVDEETSQPVDMDVSPPLIKSVRVDFHPFEDMNPTDEARVPWKTSTKGGKGSKAGPGGDGGESEVKKRRKKRKGKRDLNVLSFGDEEREIDGGAGGGGGKGGGGERAGGMRSSHDVVSHESAFLSASVDEGVLKAAKDGEKKAKKRRREQEADGEDEGRHSLEEHRMSDAAVANGNATATIKESKNESDRIVAKEGTNGNRLADERSNEQQRAASKASTRVPARSKVAPDNTTTKEKHGAEKGMSAVEARRAKYLRQGANRGGDKSKREEDTMAKLSAFRSRVLQSKGKSDAAAAGDRKIAGDNSLAARMAKRSAHAEQQKVDKEEALGPAYRGQVLEDDDDGLDVDDGGESSAAWLKTKFKCRKHIDHASKEGATAATTGGDGRNMEDYVVIDGKERGGSGRPRDHRHGHNLERGHERGRGHGHERGHGHGQRDRHGYQGNNRGGGAKHHRH